MIMATVKLLRIYQKVMILVYLKSKYLSLSNVKNYPLNLYFSFIYIFICEELNNNKKINLLTWKHTLNPHNSIHTLILSLFSKQCSMSEIQVGDTSATSGSAAYCAKSRMVGPGARGWYIIPGFGLLEWETSESSNLTFYVFQSQSTP